MTKLNERETEDLIDLGDVAVETKAGGTVLIPDSPQNQKSFQAGLSND
ncbi:benenodin family lasso peptide [Asticcacaulis sp.]|nr:benenodin family lasso peptide [Asticcacaulis sp.]HTM81568.1 benenodin family lasso peptide [Asticcacaulis sp.]